MFSYYLNLQKYFSVYQTNIEYKNHNRNIIILYNNLYKIIFKSITEKMPSFKIIVLIKLSLSISDNRK